MEQNKPQNKKTDYLIPASLIISGAFIVIALVYGAGLKEIENKQEEKMIFENGVELPVKWRDLGEKLVEVGVIDANKFEMLYNQRGGLSDEEKQLLTAKNSGNLTINSENSGYILNLLWAFGLANKNRILEQGPMADPRYGGAGNFASTGGWTMAKGETMDHYSKHQFIDLTDEQQALVERVSKNIYRPCCGNSTYFPDCNHGMAMLGLLELLASQGISENDMYRVALIVNSYWFEDVYSAIAKYFENRGIDWKDVDPKEVLGSAYSSASGYQRIFSQIEPPKSQGGGGCGL